MKRMMRSGDDGGWTTRARTMALAVVVVPSALTTATPVGAQDEAGALAAVEQVFEGMRTANADMVREVFSSEARFAVVDTREGPPTIRSQSVDGWIGAIGGSGGSWNEQIYDVDVKVDGTMASIWTPYTFYLDGEILHCGINSIELLHDADGWRVTQLSDTRREGDCPDPLGGP